MKGFLIIALFFSSFYAKAQDKPMADSAFYVLDTAKTAPSDRLWNTYSQQTVKFFELKIYSSCSELLNRPTFAYNTIKERPQIINGLELKTVKKISLSGLLLKLKQFADEDKNTKNESKTPFYLYLIEPKNGGYTIVKTQLEGSGPKRISN